MSYLALSKPHLIPFHTLLDRLLTATKPSERTNSARCGPCGDYAPQGRDEHNLDGVCDRARAYKALTTCFKRVYPSTYDGDLSGIVRPPPPLTPTR
jgi:hypothetical protein